MRNAIYTTFSQQILRDKLLSTVTSEKKSNFSDKFKLERITTYHLKKCCKRNAFQN